MILSDREIISAVRRKEVKIIPYDENMVFSSSVCLRLSNKIRTFGKRSTLDPFNEGDMVESTRLIDVKGEYFTIEPMQLILGQTKEKISISNNIVGLLEGVSGIARLGIFVHASSGLVNAGFGNKHPSTITLEIFSCCPSKVKLYPNMRICHLILFRMHTPARKGYDERIGTYSGQSEPGHSRIYQEPFGRKRGEHYG